MLTIEIEVKNKIAKSPAEHIVCGNSDYSIHFQFDEEWNAHEVKTARFLWNGRKHDEPFAGDVCPVPIISGATVCAVGVFAGNLHTTTPALVTCEKSILCADGMPEDPEPDVYAQLLAMYEEMMHVQQAEWTATKKLEGGDIVILPQKTQSFSGQTIVSGFQQTPKVGTVYDVIWDGTTYVCKAYKFDGSAFIGDLNLLETSRPSTGEPFLIQNFGGTSSFVKAKESGTHTIEITSHPYYVYNQLPAEYLPKASPVADAAGDTVTGEEFNALLAALRAAGYIET